MEYGVRHLGAERILYGSDAPGRDFAVQLARVQAADLTPEQRARILYLNAAEWLGLPC